MPLENPISPISQDFHENLGGRPLEGISQVGAPMVLERPASPVAIEDQRIAKKGKSGEGDVDGSLVNAGVKGMDTDFSESMHMDDAGVADNLVQQAVRGDKQHVSYASATANGSVSRDNSLLDSDVIEDVCPGVGATVEVQPIKDAANVNFSTEVNTTTTDLYGPWMVVSTRRRRAVAPDVNRRAGVTDRRKGSRFAVLQNTVPVDVADSVDVQNSGLEDGAEKMVSNAIPEVIPSPSIVGSQRQVQRNAAYMDSNLGRKSKQNMVGSNGGSSITIVPLGTGNRSEVVEHVLSRKSGNHTAFSIIDEGINDRGARRSKGGSGGSQTGRIGKENAAKGLRIHKTVDFRPPRRAILVEWTPYVSNAGNKASNPIQMELCNDNDPGDRQVQDEVVTVIAEDATIVGDMVGLDLPSGQGSNPLH
ncbi:hypothetical protein V6N13_043856 [Hibiscus sabdariffa]|uniref:Uncharacterized protein n=1 Tax=Hibiscus sabdariffa TaxID=183260 RepID=A0ABR2RGH5_9ROSI